MLSPPIAEHRRLLGTDAPEQLDEHRVDDPGVAPGVHVHRLVFERDADEPGRHRLAGWRVAHLRGHRRRVGGGEREPWRRAATTASLSPRSQAAPAAPTASRCALPCAARRAWSHTSDGPRACTNAAHTRAGASRDRVTLVRRTRQASVMEASSTTSAKPQPDDGGIDAEATGSALTDLVIITGFSGAGKSTAMAAFEDEGYFCVDNLPVGDDPLAGRAVHARRLEGGPRGRRLGRPGRELLRGAGGDARRPPRQPASRAGCCSSRPTSSRC